MGEWVEGCETQIVAKGGEVGVEPRVVAEREAPAWVSCEGRGEGKRGET